ncbi:dnaJ-like protein subfamily B member 4-like protein [Pilobolus umbonatus]|nr:dnaJ-like protein subfamily B member 4-like protein [Pilobolus umbonatus]
MSTLTDYCTALGISHDATTDEIKKAYRKQALKWHPDRCKDPSAKVEFQKIAEAFEVLSKKKELNSKFDYTYPRSFSTNNPHFSKNAEDLFSQYFSTFSTPYSTNNTHTNNERFGGYFNCENKPKSVKRVISVSLDDLYTGVTKRMKVIRNVNNKKKDKILSINIQPGWREGTTICFPGAGDQLSSGRRQDIEFELHQVSHPVFKREGDNLHITLSLSLLESLVGFKKTITKLDGTTAVVENSNSVIHSGNETILIGEGMPRLNNPTDKGDLIVHFCINFPTELTTEQCDALKKILV